ncbi:MAG: CvpA family protein [Flavobacterium sp.]
MIVIDLLIVVYIIYKIYTGFKNGFISEISSLLSIIIALFVATHFYEHTLSFMQAFQKSDSTDMIVFARVITFVFALIVVLVAFNSLSKLINVTVLGIFDKILGSVFGFLKSILIVSIFLNIFAKFNAGKLMIMPNKLVESRLFYPVLKVSHQMFPTFGSWYAQYVFLPKASDNTEENSETNNDNSDKK